MKIKEKESKSEKMTERQMQTNGRAGEQKERE